MDTLFADNEAGAVNDVLVIPRIIGDKCDIRQALVFLSAQPIEPQDARFLHSAAGLHFAQQAIWNSGRRREPAVALRPARDRNACAGRSPERPWPRSPRSPACRTGPCVSISMPHGPATASRPISSCSSRRQRITDSIPTPMPYPPPTRTASSSPTTRAACSRSGPNGAIPRDRRAAADRRQVILANLPFPDRRKGGERRNGLERRAIVPAEEPHSATDSILTPEEIRVLLN